MVVVTKPATVILAEGTVVPIRFLLDVLATERLILLVSLTSFSCLAISSPKRYWLFAGTSIAQTGLYYGLRAGCIWSRSSCANCVFK